MISAILMMIKPAKVNSKGSMLETCFLEAKATRLNNTA